MNKISHVSKIGIAMFEKKPDMTASVRRSRPAPDPQFSPLDQEMPPEKNERQDIPPAKAEPTPLPEPKAAPAAEARVEPPRPVSMPPPPAHATEPQVIRVVVTDIHMSFSSIVVFMVKAAFAVLPALFIIIGICLFVISLFTGYAKYR